MAPKNELIGDDCAFSNYVDLFSWQWEGNASALCSFLQYFSSDLSGPLLEENVIVHIQQGGGIAAISLGFFYPSNFYALHRKTEDVN